MRLKNKGAEGEVLTMKAKAMTVEKVIEEREKKLIKRPQTTN